MIRAPRCPVCKTWLSADRTIDERFLPEEAAWDYRYACASCLSVVVQRIPEISESRPRVTASAAAVDIAGAVVARVLASLRDAAEQGRLPDAVTTLVRDEQRRMLMRIPEVFSVARPGWGEMVRLAAQAWYPRLDATMFPQTRSASTTLMRDEFEYASSFRVVVSKGDRMRVVRVDDARFVLERASISRLDLILDPAELIATPDLVLPDLGSVA